MANGDIANRAAASADVTRKSQGQGHVLVNIERESHVE
jgi:hypothetical protein